VVPYCDSEIKNGRSDYKRIQPMPSVLLQRRSVTVFLFPLSDNSMSVVM
jgi:hypothetical protein